jgi:hypothetical protein
VFEEKARGKTKRRKADAAYKHGKNVDTMSEAGRPETDV